MNFHNNHFCHFLSLQISSSPLDQSEIPSGFQVLATKTYFTTSTYFTTLIDKSRTITRTRTKVKSSIVTETYSGGAFNDYGSTNVEPTQLVPGENQVKYLSLGPNIYGKIKTLFATYTYFTTDVLGSVAKSMEVITQVSTSLFSTTRLPSSVKIEPSVKPVQLGADELNNLKQSYIESLESSETTGAGILATKPSGGAGILWDKPYLSSLKESFEASLSSGASGEASDRPGIPDTDLNLPDNGPIGIVPPNTDEIRPSRPTEQGGTQDEALVAPANSDQSTSSNTPGDLDTAQSQNTNNNENSNNSGNQGGIINAVVGGIADGLGLGDSGDVSSGIQVDLGPVLDAVATLLRGPIRSAIANRRSESLQQRSEAVQLNLDNSRLQTQRPVLPKIARERGQDPNYIPIGGHNPFLRPDQPPQPQPPNAIPLRVPPPQQRNANGDVLQALPRSDTQGELEYLDPLQLPNEVQALLNKNKGQDILVDGDKLIINGHVVQTNNPTIYDVLNRREQDHLFGKSGGPMAIKILAGKPMNIPKQVKVPGKPLDPNEVTMIGSLEEELPPPPPPAAPSPPSPPTSGKRPPSPPPPPPGFKKPGPPPKRPRPPRPPPRRPENRPLPVPQHGPRGAKPPPPGSRYPTRGPEDSKNEFSQNSEVVIQPPTNSRPLNGIPPPPPKNFNQRPPPNQGPPRRPPPRGPPPKPKLPPPPPQFQRPNQGQQGQQQRPQQEFIQQTYQQQNNNLPASNYGNNQIVIKEEKEKEAVEAPSSRPYTPPRQPQPPSQRPSPEQPPVQKPPPNQEKRPPFIPPPRPSSTSETRPFGGPLRPSPTSETRPYEPQRPRPSQETNGPYFPSGQPPRPSGPPPPQENRPPYQPPRPSGLPPQENRPPYQPPRPSGSPPPQENRPPYQPPRPSGSPPQENIPPYQQPRPSSSPSSENRPSFQPPRLPENRPPYQPPSQPPQQRPTPETENTPPQPTQPQRPPFNPPPPKRPQSPNSVERPTQFEKEPQRRPPFTARPQAPVSRPRLPPYGAQNNQNSHPNFGQKLPQATSAPDFTTAKDQSNSNEILINEREYTPIDTPSRDPAFARPTPPVNYNRYDINGGGSRRPYQENDHNKARQPTTKAPTQAPLEIITIAPPVEGQNQDRGTFDIVVNNLQGTILARDEVTQSSSASIDYQGWYTEGDTIQLRPSTTSSSRFYTDLNIREKEGAKTTTYANEWSTPRDDYRTRIPFVPKSRPPLNTNFEREWTATIEVGAIEPTRPYVPNGPVLRPTEYDPRGNNNWNTVGSRRPPPSQPQLENNEDLSGGLNRRPTPRPSFPRRPVQQPSTNEAAERGDSNEGSAQDNTRPGTQFPSTNLINREERPTFETRPIIGGRPAVEDIIFGANRPRKKLPPIQQPPRRNDVIGIPDAIPLPGQDVFRPQRRPIRPTPSILDQIPKDEDGIDVIEGTFENRPVIPFRTDKLPFATNSIDSSDRPNRPESDFIEPTTIRRTRLRLPTASKDNSEENESTTRQFPPGTFINIDPSRGFRPQPPSSISETASEVIPTESTASRKLIVRPTVSTINRPEIIRPTIRPTETNEEEPQVASTTEVVTEVTRRPLRPRPSIFPPKVIRDEVNKNTDQDKIDDKVQVAGAPFLPTFGKRPYVKESDELEDVRRKETVVGDKINPAIVEGIPGNALSAEDTDPETRCQNTCGQNEICQINARGGIECKCRPGFGRSDGSRSCKSESHISEFLHRSFTLPFGFISFFRVSVVQH